MDAERGYTSNLARRSWMREGMPSRVPRCHGWQGAAYLPKAVLWYADRPQMELYLSIYLKIKILVPCQP